MNEKIFSICIPVYNSEEFFSRCLDSIVQQNFDKKIEVIIVNDNSPKSELCDMIVNEYKSKLYIHYIKKDVNEGLYLARKTGVENATGEYILFLDSDDTIEPETCSVLFPFIKNKPDYIQFKSYNIDNAQKTIFEYPLGESSKTIADVLLDRVPHNVWSKCYNASFLTKIYSELPNFYSVYAEDYYQSAIIEYFAKKKIFIDNVLYNYFRNQGITSGENFDSEKKFIAMDRSMQNIIMHLTAFFEERNELYYARCVKDYFDYLNFRYLQLTNSKAVFDRIVKNIPEKYIQAAVLIELKNMQKSDKIGILHKGWLKIKGVLLK